MLEYRYNYSIQQNTTPILIDPIVRLHCIEGTVPISHGRAQGLRRETC